MNNALNRFESKKHQARLVFLKTGKRKADFSTIGEIITAGISFSQLPANRWILYLSR